MAERKRLVVLGSGFGALMVAKDIDLRLYSLTVVSPRNHFLFTPLLPSTTVGTVELRSIIEPIRKVRRGIDYVQGTAVAVDPERRVVSAQSVDPAISFEVPYDELVIAVGADNATFGIPGVVEHAHFLKELNDARVIREAIVSCLERADVPGIPDETRRRLLHFVVVGGGPTGVEFAAELHDLLEEDLARSYPDLVGQVRITLFEALPTILTTFDQKLREYTISHFARQGIELRLDCPVAAVGERCLHLRNGETVEAEVIVWSTGNAARTFVRSLPFKQDQSGRLITDAFLRLEEAPEIIAIGDCATTEAGPLPQTAQAAMQEGRYVARMLNRGARGRTVRPFAFQNMGMLAYIGASRALADIPSVDVKWRGQTTYYFWRSAYLTRLVSFKNKVLVLFDWIKTRVFGRDLSKV